MNEESTTPFFGYCEKCGRKLKSTSYSLDGITLCGLCYRGLTQENTLAESVANINIEPIKIEFDFNETQKKSIRKIVREELKEIFKVSGLNG